MNNKKLKIIFAVIGIFAVVPLLMNLPLSSDSNVTTTSSASNVLFPDANADIYVEINHHWNSKATVGDAAKDDGFFIITDTYVDLESCEFCTRIQYTPGEERVAGFSYLDNDGFDLTNAKRVTVLAKHVAGDADVRFLVGGEESFTANQGLFKNVKFAKITKPIELDYNWEYIEIDLRGQDLSQITHPFAVEVNPSPDSEQIVFYIKNIYVDTKDPQNPIATEDGSSIVIPEGPVATENEIEIDS